MLTWKALPITCSPSFAPSKFTIICLPYQFLRAWKHLLTEEKFHSHLLAHRKLTAAPAALRSSRVFHANVIHAFQQSAERHKQSPGSCQHCWIPRLQTKPPTGNNASQLCDATEVIRGFQRISKNFRWFLPVKSWCICLKTPWHPNTMGSHLWHQGYIKLSCFE